MKADLTQVKSVHLDEADEHNHAMETLELDDYDPTLWCNICGAATSKQCDCPPISKDD